MTVKPWAGFIADFPDDTVEEGGDITLFGGRNVAVAIRDILTRLGCQVSEPDYGEAHGWTFDAYYRGGRYWCQVTSFHPAYFLLLDSTAVILGARKKNAAYAELAVRLAAALAKDQRFHNVTWHSRRDGPPVPDEIGTLGADSDGPLAPDDMSFGGRAKQWGQGCLPIGLILLILFGGVIAVAPGLVPGSRSENIFAGVFWIVVGLFLLIRRSM
jgi:hypothetical protein